MKVIGLTGSIGMGKSTAAAMFRRLGVPVHDSDAAVHRLLGRGGAAVRLVEEAFPGVVRNGAVDRAELGRRVFGNPAALRRLEAILHPLVRKAAARFVARARAQRRDLVVLDVPLLFETQGDRRCDVTVVVSAPAFVQRARVLARPGMTEARLAQVLAQQMPDAEKRARADFVVETGLGKRYTLGRIKKIVSILRSNARSRPRHRNYRARSR
ncbi:MAG: dephospho-CoA kinase [Rhodospirillales bacterium]|nr:dephospho-CoA kinase [Rhodospirillales bacterium]